MKQDEGRAGAWKVEHQAWKELTVLREGHLVRMVWRACLKAEGLVSSLQALGACSKAGPRGPMRVPGALLGVRVSWPPKGAGALRVQVWQRGEEVLKLLRACSRGLEGDLGVQACCLLEGVA